MYQNLCPGGFFQFAVAADMVKVTMGVDDVSQFQTLLGNVSGDFLVFTFSEIRIDNDCL